MRNIDAETVAHRCKRAGVTGIYKSYIRGIELVARRRGPDWLLEEIDLAFTHKGTRYIVREKTMGDKRYSAARSYTVEVVPKWW